MFHPIFKTFTDKTLEEKYQIQAMPNIKNALYFGLMIFWINSVLIIFSDLFILQYELSFMNPVVIGRLTFLMVLTVVFIIVWLSKNPDVTNIAVFIFFVMLTCITALVHYINPEPEHIYYSIEMAVIIAMYLVFPIGIRYRLAGAIMFSLAMIASLHKFAVPDWFLYQVIILFITVNVIGFVIARYMSVTFRRLFLRRENISILKTEIELATNDIKIIKDIIPICASCKKVRDDSGFWGQLEDYFKRISNIEFVGDKCPKCIEKEVNES